MMGEIGNAQPQSGNDAIVASRVLSHRLAAARQRHSCDERQIVWHTRADGWSISRDHLRGDLVVSVCDDSGWGSVGSRSRRT